MEIQGEPDPHLFLKSEYIGSDKEFKPMILPNPNGTITPIITVEEMKRLHQMCQQRIDQDILAIGGDMLSGDVFAETKERIQQVAVLKYKLGEMINLFDV